MRVNITKSNSLNKRFKAVFYDEDGYKIKTVHFGAKNGSTYIDHKDKVKRDNYIKRHKALNEDWTNPLTAGALSRFVLWGVKSNLQDAIKQYKWKFGLK